MLTYADVCCRGAAGEEAPASERACMLQELAELAERERAVEGRERVVEERERVCVERGTQFACFAGTKVQILTLLLLLQA